MRGSSRNNRGSATDPGLSVPSRRATSTSRQEGVSERERRSDSREDRSNSSSASTCSAQSPRPWASSRQALRGAAKSSSQGCSPTTAPNLRAISTVRSLEPVSTKQIPSTTPDRDDRHLSRFRSSSRAIRQAINRIVNRNLAISDRESPGDSGQGAALYNGKCPEPRPPDLSGVVRRFQRLHVGPGRLGALLCPL